MSLPRLRVGIGFDVHPFATALPAGYLHLGGVDFPEAPSLEGHSDADVLCHAVIDAMLGAAGLGDIGEHFSDTDGRWEGASGLVLLSESAALLSEAGWKVVDVDTSVVVDAPRLAPHRGEMQKRMSEAAGGEVRVKAKRSEGLGSLGRGEGIAAWAVALICAADETTS